jgi:hypothetical protein
MVLGVLDIIAETDINSTIPTLLHMGFIRRKRSQSGWQRNDFFRLRSMFYTPGGTTEHWSIQGIRMDYVMGILACAGLFILSTFLGVK